MTYKIFRGIIVFILLSITALALAKGGVDTKYVTVNKISPFEKEALLVEIRTIMERASANQITRVDPNCDDLQISETADYLQIRSNSKDYYILYRESYIDGKKYMSSVCYKKTANDLIQVECISRSKESINDFEKQKDLTFYAMYSEKALISCPSREYIK